jgi:hypothetical protein
VPWLAILVIGVLAVFAGGIGWYMGSDPDGEGSATERTPSAAPSTPRSTEPKPEKESATPQGMQDFVQRYLSTVTSDPKAAWAMLTPSFQKQSGGYGQYKRFWSGFENAEVTSASADPEAKTISYTVEYTRRDGSTTTDDVTLRLDGVDGDYLIAGER